MNTTTYLDSIQAEIDHYMVVLGEYASGVRLVTGHDGRERRGTRHDLMGFVRDVRVAAAIEEEADRLGLD